MKSLYLAMGILLILASFAIAQLQPAKDAIVTLDWNDGRHTYSNSTIADANGYYEMNVASGNINLSAGMGFHRGNELLMIGNWSNFSINGIKWRNFTLIMPEENAKIYGYVYDNESHALIEANISIYFEAFDEKYAGLNYTLTKNGYYEIWLPASNVSIIASANGYNTSFYDLNISEGEERRIDFYLDAMPTAPLTTWIEGYIKGNGQPINNASVEVYIHNDSYNYTFTNFTFTPSNGYFKFKVPSGKGGIVVNAADFFPYIGNITTKEGVTTWINISLNPLPPNNAWISGYAYDNEGNPIAGANISVEGSITINHFQTAYFERYGITDGNGYYNISVPSIQPVGIPGMWPPIIINVSTIDAIYANKAGYFDNGTILYPPSNVIKPGQTLNANVILDKMPVENCKVKGYVYLKSLPEMVSHILYVGGIGQNNYTSIQDAINNASDGDIIKVYPGIYEPIIINKEIRLIGDPVIDGHGNIGIKIEANNVSIENFTIFNCSTGIYVYTYPHTITNVSIEKCVIHSCSQHGIEFKNVNYAVIDGNMVYNCSKHGLRLWYAENFSIINNTIFNNNWDGIFFDAHSDNNVVIQNKIYNNLNDGIETYNSFGNSILSNVVFNNSHNGIHLSGSRFNNISENRLHDNNYGIYLVSNSGNNTIISNTIINNQYGIYLYSSNNNNIYNNYFNNTINAWDDGNNKWNVSKMAGSNIIGGSWLGGNYWNDYEGSDVNGDGLGDTMLPYNCNGNIINGGDMLPLVSHLNDKIPPRIERVSYMLKYHVGLVNITCVVNDNIAISGVWINITLPNGSTIKERMIYSNGIYYYNSYFNLTGNYSFHIYALDENGNENISTTMKFEIYPKWDLDMNHRINILDLIIVAMHFGSQEGEEGYSKKADLNNDGKINILDLIIVAMHWTG